MLWVKGSLIGSLGRIVVDLRLLMMRVLLILHMRIVKGIRLVHDNLVKTFVVLMRVWVVLVLISAIIFGF